MLDNRESLVCLCLIFSVGYKKVVCTLRKLKPDTSRQGNNSPNTLKSKGEKKISPQSLQSPANMQGHWYHRAWMSHISFHDPHTHRYVEVFEGTIYTSDGTNTYTTDKKLVRHWAQRLKVKLKRFSAQSRGLQPIRTGSEFRLRTESRTSQLMCPAKHRPDLGQITVVLEFLKINPTLTIRHAVFAVFINLAAVWPNDKL